MGDQNQRLVLDERGEVPADVFLARIVHGRGRFVEHEDGDLFQQGPGYGDSLPLPGGETLSPFSDLHVEATGMQVGEAVHSRGDGGFENFRVAPRRVPEHQVFLQRAEKEDHVLRNRTDVSAEPAGIDLTDVRSVDEDGAALRLIKPEEKFSHGALSRSDAPHEGHPLPVRDSE